MFILLAIGLVAVAIILLSVRVIIKKNGRFSSQHISESKTMRERGIHCVASQDREARHPNTTRIDVNTL